jgi:glutathione S-transferase
MSRLELFGTVTSPYVRRVRIVLAELGVDYELVNTAESAGQQLLRELNPIWKVPTLRIDGQVIFDSAVIVSHVLERFGPGPFAASGARDLDARAVVTVADGALDALINRFYLAKEGVSVEQVPYLQKQRDRAAASLGWLDARAEAGFVTRDRSFGLAEIAVITALEWMRFRSVYPIERHPNLGELLLRHADRESMRTTLPSG